MRALMRVFIRLDLVQLPSMLHILPVEKITEREKKTSWLNLCLASDRQSGCSHHIFNYSERRIQNEQYEWKRWDVINSKMQSGTMGWLDCYQHVCSFSECLHYYCALALSTVFLPCFLVLPVFSCTYFSFLQKSSVLSVHLYFRWRDLCFNRNSVLSLTQKNALILSMYIFYTLLDE